MPKASYAGGCTRSRVRPKSSARPRGVMYGYASAAGCAARKRFTRGESPSSSARPVMSTGLKFSGYPCPSSKAFLAARCSTNRTKRSGSFSAESRTTHVRRSRLTLGRFRARRSRSSRSGGRSTSTSASGLSVRNQTASLSDNASVRCAASTQRVSWLLRNSPCRPKTRKLRYTIATGKLRCRCRHAGRPCQSTQHTRSGCSFFL
mmetsp:Transcript_3963/g.11988  ORF Transcript_3963/g.11988 Transcript_3963/m.11988 type:complete len:205 (-) Transcript_3963:424-1038(-)